MGTHVNSTQVGGDHYRLMPFQHWDYVVCNGLGYLEGNATKYVCRWRYKNGVQDLEKAEHYIKKLLTSVREGIPITPPGSHGTPVPPRILVDSMDLGQREAEILELLSSWKTEMGIEEALHVVTLLKEEAFDGSS